MTIIFPFTLLKVMNCKLVKVLWSFKQSTIILCRCINGSRGKAKIWTFIWAFEAQNLEIILDWHLFLLLPFILCQMSCTLAWLRRNSSSTILSPIVLSACFYSRATLAILIEIETLSTIGSSSWQSCQYKIVAAG